MRNVSDFPPSYLEFAGLPVHGKLGVVHRAHELDAGRHHEQHLVAHAHPQPLQESKNKCEDPSADMQKMALQIRAS